MGYRYSHATGSRIIEVAQERVHAFLKRYLEPHHAVIYLDALFVKVLRPEVGIRKEAVYVALGVTQEGRCEVLGFHLFPEEAARVWRSEVPWDLEEHGLHEVLMVVTDDLPKMGEAIGRTFPGTDWRKYTRREIPWPR
ncbi:MAG: transposase [Candidatus Hadarchaeum sp.]